MSFYNFKNEDNKVAMAMDLKNERNAAWVKISEVKPIPWDLGKIWNETTHAPSRPLVRRDYIYASEISMPFIDRFYKMKAIPFTNPPNNRSLNKFLAGRIWEFVVKQILITAGIYKKEEVQVNGTPYSDCLSIHGRVDFLAGGYIDKEAALANIEILHLPEFLHDRATKIITSLAGGFLEKKILELKAVSTYAMELVMNRNSAVPAHTLQAYHYQKNSKIKAFICYICKDNSLLREFAINSKEAEVLYKDDIQQMTNFFTKNKVPPKEPIVKFDTILARFYKNLGIEWSPYLTKIYGYESPDTYRNAVAFTEKWNRALARFALAQTGGTTPTGKPITVTPKNVEVKKDIIKAGFNFDECLRCKIAAGVAEEEIES